MARTCLEQVGCRSIECHILMRMCGDFLAADFVSNVDMNFTGFDGEVLPASCYAPLCKRQPVSSATKPLMVGSSANEWRFFQHKGRPYSARSSIEKFLRFYLKGYQESDQAVHACVRQKLLRMYEEAGVNCSLCSQLGDPKRGPTRWRH